MPPTPKKTEKPKKTGQVEVEFSLPPNEILHFNRYSVDSYNTFLQISLWFQDNFSVMVPVFRGLIWKPDFNEQVARLKLYIEKIGSSVVDSPYSRPPAWTTPPVSFNIIDCVSRGEYSEIIVRNYSHKFVMEAATSKTQVKGITHGVYVSDGVVHRQLIMDLIKELSAK